MRIYNKEDGSTIAFVSFMFPDGQWHIDIKDNVTFDVVIETAIRNNDELMLVLLANNALQSLGCTVSLDIRYLMGARMDRRIGVGQPATLEVIARMLMGCGFKRIRVLDAHSTVALTLLNATNVLPYAVVNGILDRHNTRDTVIVIPDKGAASRVESLVDISRGFRYAHGSKIRDPQTGRLSGFGVDGEVEGKTCFIIDDICDGGGTFSGLAQVLRSRGAVWVDLFVTHGIFSKGLPLQGIDSVYCTDSYMNPELGFAPDPTRVYWIPISMRSL